MRGSDGHTADMPDNFLFFEVRGQHEAPCVDQRNRRQTVRHSQLHETRCFACRIRADGTVQVLRAAGCWLLAIKPMGWPLVWA